MDTTTESLAFMELDPSLDGVGAKLVGERHPIESSLESLDVDHAQHFWKLAADLTGFHGL